MGIAVTLAQYLLDRNVAYELVPHPHTETASASVAASGVPAESVVKAVVLTGRDGFMVALLPALRHIQFDELRRMLGDDVNMASEEQIETLFLDCQPGSVPAIGAAYGLVDAFECIRFGVDQARRGWLAADDVINTRSLTDLPKTLRR